MPVDPSRSEFLQKGYRLPSSTLLKLADYCLWERKQYQDTVNLALLEYVHQAEIERGEVYQPHPSREKILKKGNQKITE